MGFLGLFGGTEKTAPTTKKYPAKFISVVGESHYQSDLWKIVGGSRGAAEVTWKGKSLLVPEPSNPYDKHAVKVTVSGKTVGYLAGDLAEELQGPILRLGKEIEVACEVRGGRIKDSEGRIILGVVLSFSPLAIKHAFDAPAVPTTKTTKKATRRKK
jgi:hypothetical protein